MPLDLQETLSDLVSRPSVNPMGRSVSGAEFFEKQVTDYLERLFDTLSLPWQRQTVAPNRDNIVARIDGDRAPEQGGALLLFEAHQDTVPVDGMTIEPFQPQVRDGRLYGRGACDVKGGLTAILLAGSRLARERPGHLPTILLASTVNEEYGFTGAKALGKLWEAPGSLIPRAPDAAIILEPTELNVVVAHKGVVRWRLTTRGRAAHSSQPRLGENAIYRMAKVLQLLESFQRDALASRPSHALCGGPTLSVGTIQGGLSVNTVPDACTVEIDRRLVPGEKPEDAVREIRQMLDRALDSPDWIVHEPVFMTGGGLSDERNRALGEAVVAAAGATGVTSRTIGVPYGTNAAATSAAGVPSIVFGPGSLAQAHTADEWIELDQVARAAEVLFQTARRWS